MIWRWNQRSPIFDSMAWLQALWASRKAVRLDFFLPFESPSCITSHSVFYSFDDIYCICYSCATHMHMIDLWGKVVSELMSKQNIQNRSFIEQQMVLYSDTGCFGRSQEVLRRDVEVVEYMNDLIDSFN